MGNKPFSSSSYFLYYLPVTETTRHRPLRSARHRSDREIIPRHGTTYNTCMQPRTQLQPPKKSLWLCSRRTWR